MSHKSWDIYPYLAKLKSGEYDGVDIMSARLAIEYMYDRIEQLQKQVEELKKENKDLRGYIIMLRNRNGCGDGCIGCEWCMPPECMTGSKSETSR